MTQVIKKVKSTSASTYTNIPAQPSSYDVSYSDVSNADAGRTSDGKMHKGKIGTCAIVALAWKAVSESNAMSILTLFAYEYINLEYFDAKTASYLTVEFFVGDRKAHCENGDDSKWTISFNCIQRTPS